MTSTESLHWEHLRAAEYYSLRRCGRYLTVELVGAHLVLSTSVRNGGRSSQVADKRRITTSYAAKWRFLPRKLRFWERRLT
jgi:hypothetical protein